MSPPVDRLTWHVNGHTLTAERHAYRGWHFACDSWPALAAAHDGDADPVAVVGEFMRRAGAVRVEAEGNGHG